MLTIVIGITIAFLSFTWEHKVSSPKIFSTKKIAFLVHGETFGGKGVYELYIAMKKIGHEVKIIAIPYFYYGNLFCEVDINLMTKFDENDVIYPCGTHSPYEKCKIFTQHKYDYIFIQNPYNTYVNSVLDPLFLPSELRKLAKKVMFIVYGPHIFHQDTINDTDLKNIVDNVFVDSESTRNIYVERYNFPSNRIIVSGYQPYKSIRQSLTQKVNNFDETVLWLPRWTLSFRDRVLFEGGSTFLNYHHFFYNYALSNPNKYLIIRPHELLYTYSVSNHYLSQNDLDEIFNKYQKLKNVTISRHSSRPLINDVLEADIIISDGTSALGEVVVADKPIIYLSNGWNNEFNSNELSKELKKYVLLAYDPSDIISHLELIRKNNYKPLWDELERKRFRELVDPIENPDEFIAQFLLQSSP
jgi:hypothetical protein